MTPDALLVALHECDITIAPEGQAIRFHAPEGAITEPLAAALSQHKMLILAVFATLRKPSCAAAWGTVIEWLADGKPGPVPPPVLTAGKKLGLPYGANEFPPAYAERMRMALRVRGLLLAFGEAEAPVSIAAEQPAAQDRAMLGLGAANGGGNAPATPTYTTKTPKLPNPGKTKRAA